MAAISTQRISGVTTPVFSMVGVAGAALDMPFDGDFAIVGGFIYEWAVVEDLGNYERWGWELYGPARDAGVLGVPADTPRYDMLPIFD